MTCKLFPSEEKLLKTFEHSKQKPLVWAQTVPDFLHLRVKGYRIKIIAPLADISASYQMIIRNESGIVLPGDLEGRRIGIVRGSLIEVALRNMARDFGVDLAAIRFVDTDPLHQLELFVNQALDAVACWEPWASQARYVGGSLYFSGRYSHIPGHEGPVSWLTGQSMLVTFEETLLAESETLKNILNAIYKATNYLNSTLRKAASVFSDLLDVEHDELVTLLQKNMYSMKMNDLFYIGLAAVLDIFAELEPPAVSEQTPPERAALPLAVDDLYTSALLGQVDPILVRQGLPPQVSEVSAPAEIVAEGTIYYPAQAHISARKAVSLRYIIVDDTQIVIELFSSIVDMLEGAVVGTASTGSEGMVLYFDLLPDVVVMDISMPDMNGIEAIKGILRMNPGANIIVVTGNNYEDTRKHVFELGVKLFIGKPFSVNEVARILRTLIR